MELYAFTPWGTWTEIGFACELLESFQDSFKTFPNMAGPAEVLRRSTPASACSTKIHKLRSYYHTDTTKTQQH